MKKKSSKSNTLMIRELVLIAVLLIAAGASGIVYDNVDTLFGQATAPCTSEVCSISSSGSGGYGFSVNHYPSNPKFGETVTLTAKVTNSPNVTFIKIYMNNTLVKTCGTNACTYNVYNLNLGRYSYHAEAMVKNGSIRRSPQSGYKYFTVTV